MKILVVSPHPDDETLGAGGTILKLKQRGQQVYWLNITNITTEKGWDADIVAHRQEQIKEVCAYYDFDGFYDLGLSPTKLSCMDEGKIIGGIKGVFEEVLPEWLIIPGQYDAHSDHRVVYNACMASAKSFRAPYIKRITTMEILSETEFGYQPEKFTPNMYVDITDTIEGKLNAMKIYDTELGNAPFPRSLKNILANSEIRGGGSRLPLC